MILWVEKPKQKHQSNIVVGTIIPLMSFVLYLFSEFEAINSKVTNCVFSDYLWYFVWIACKLVTCQRSRIYIFLELARLPLKYFLSFSYADQHLPAEVLNSGVTLLVYSWALFDWGEVNAAGMLSIMSQKKNTKSRTANENIKNVMRQRIIFQKLEIPSDEVSEMECMSWDIGYLMKLKRV